MFPDNASITRLSPSLLPGSDGTRSPAFNRYYETATTAKTPLASLRLFSVARQYLGLTPYVRSPTRGSRRAGARVLVNRYHPLFPVCCPKDVFGSPKFPANP